MSQHPMMTTSRASDYLRTVYGISRTSATLAKLRCLGGGPRFVKVSSNVLYSREALDAWVAGFEEFAHTGAVAAGRAQS